MNNELSTFYSLQCALCTVQTLISSRKVHTSFECVTLGAASKHERSHVRVTFTSENCIPSLITVFRVSRRIRRAAVQLSAERSVNSNPLIRLAYVNRMLRPNECFKARVLSAMFHLFVSCAARKQNVSGLTNCDLLYYII